MRISRTASVCPELSPLRQSALRERLQKCAALVSTVSASASRLAQATMRIIPVRASWAITGQRPLPSKVTASSKAFVSVRHGASSRTGTPRARR